MPCWDGYRYVNLGPFIRAWEKHYIAKGCGPRKAEELARKKARKRRMP